MDIIQFPSSTAGLITGTISEQLENFLPLIIIVVGIPATFYIISLFIELLSGKKPIDNEIDTTQNDY